MLRAHRDLPPIPPVRLPRADSDATEAFCDELDALRAALPALRATCSDRFRVLGTGIDVPHHGAALALSIPLAETCLDSEPEDIGPELLAQLAFLVLLRGVPQQVALQIAFGWGIAHEHGKGLAPVLQYESSCGVHVDAIFSALDPMGEMYETRAAEWFRGEAPYGPDAARAAHGIALFRRAAAHAPEWMRPPLLCVVAWLYWAIGKRANALAHLAGIDREWLGGEAAESLQSHLASTLPCWLPARL